MTTDLSRLKQHIEGGFVNPCQTHEGHHLMKIIGIEDYPFDIFCWDKYKDTKGYCPADDAVSQSIDVGGVWEAHVTKVFDQILSQESEGIVVDIGAHVGWYACRAVRAGYPTLAVEANNACISLLTENMDQWAKDGTEYEICRGWIDDLVAPYIYRQKIHLMKIDIEGNEQFAFKIFEHAFGFQQVDYCIMEVSPVFNLSYEGLIRRILSMGYRCWRIDQQDNHNEWTEENFVNKLADYPQVDVVFKSPGAENLW